VSEPRPCPQPLPSRAAGLYDPSYEHDACGVACVARLDGQPRHDVIDLALDALDDLEHRGAAGADPTTGDGAGILIQLPHGFLRSRVGEFGVTRAQLPDAGSVAVASVFLSGDPTRWESQQRTLEQAVVAAGQLPLGWRQVPVDLAACGETARDVAPEFRQLLVGAGPEIVNQDEFERRLFVARRIAELETEPDFSIPSLSSRTLVYKGMLSAPQLQRFYADLRDPELQSALAVVHSRFSTNTFPSWDLAQPLRLLAHNGEINTLAGNFNWMRAREAALHSNLVPDLERCLPLIPDGSSDSAAFDRVLELLTLAGRPLAQAMMMMIPAAHEHRDDMPPELDAFYRYSSSVIEPWDGPAAMVFSDGRMLGACLDRNGLRPGRWLVTDEGLVVLGSEAGVLPVDPAKVVRRGRLHPGRLFIVDLERNLLQADGEAELEVARRKPYGRWCDQGEIRLADLTERIASRTHEPLRTQQLAFGYSQEDLRVLISPAAEAGIEPTGSMGNDLALAALSEQEPSLFSYFKQRFAQVTNPPIDSVRESIVMSLESRVGSEGNMLSEGPEHAVQLVLDHPVLTNDELERVARASHPALRGMTLDATWPLEDGEAGLEAALERIAREASAAITGEAKVLVISDRALSAERVPIPAMLALGAVHQHLVKEGTRLQTSLVVETGEAREIHHLAALIGYGAAAVNPYLMLDSLSELHGRAELPPGVTLEVAHEGLMKAIRKGLLKVMSKMGIATISSYCGAQVFEAVGLDRDLVDRYFGGTPSAVGGVGLAELGSEALERHARAYPDAHRRSLPEHVEDSALPAAHASLLPQGGVYAWRRDGERHAWDPQTIAALQLAVGKNGKGNGRPPTSDPQRYEEFRERVDIENGALSYLRGLLELRPAGDPIPIDEVEPLTQILKRFTTGGMSLGALGPEAHETLAVAMNRIGGMSNSGEGGEDIRRYTPDPNGDERRSRIKQVASGRFGVTVHYLSSADQIQIKISQGAKPGEGGQLPGHKVDPYIAQLRFATPGVGLISPPPHHDIYSIEDLKQLIYDLRSANPKATVSVKLAAEAGVGTVAAGVAKAGADHVVIAGHDGGTGASPLSSIQQAGVPWEIGLAETQQTLLRNDLRSRIVVQVDGGMRTGRDVLVGAMLGADEFGFSTAPLIATGCIMMRVCHLNTCPVGVATQDPELRARFAGRPEHVVNYLFLVADDVRKQMAQLGLARLEDAIGRVELLGQEHPTQAGSIKRRLLDLSDLLVIPESVDPRAVRHRTRGPAPDDPHFDERRLLDEARRSIATAEPVRIEAGVTNVDRAIGARLSHELVSEHGPAGLADDTIAVKLAGSAGQSFGAFLAPGISLALEGEANDYVGKSLSGGVLAVHPPEESSYVASENVIIGNVALYGASSGRAFFRGLAGERFAVRNSGALTVVEGVGDHGCEYMTGGRAAIIGPTGHNFGAGMSGGIAWVFDPDDQLAARANTELIDLEPMTGAPEEDREELLALVTEHLARTGSEVAAHLLADWEISLAQFVRVIPREYARALERREEVGGPKTAEFRTLAA
jgi:glutamate synthase domain-containing protein 2/glutamate synthase domain-containing protein 1/glutamate synthase domain-containing protein 3